MVATQNIGSRKSTYWKRTGCWWEKIIVHIGVYIELS